MKTEIRIMSVLKNSSKNSDDRTQEVDLLGPRLFTKAVDQRMGNFWLWKTSKSKEVLRHIYKGGALPPHRKMPHPHLSG